MEPYYQDDSCTIYHADCEKILPSLSGVDLVFTSPPYNLGVSTGGGMGYWSGTGKGGHGNTPRIRDLGNGYGGEYDDAMPQEEYEAWQRTVVALLIGTLSPRGAVFYNHKPRLQAKRLLLPIDYGPREMLRQIIVWDRERGLNFSESYYLPKSEWLVVWAQPAFRLVSHSASQVGDVWRVPPENDPRHPASFPISLPARAIDTTAPDLVLDPFMGSGTTLRAAKDANVRAVGIEISERYCEIAAKRLAQEVLPL